jgi:ubiquinone/menaquinone biosynthesis C-methylase UbiE
MDQTWNDRTAQAYLSRYGDHELNRLWLNHVSLKEDTFLLDVGCGGGASLKAASKAMKGIRAVGIDPMPVMISAARELLPRVDFYEATAESIPLPAEVVSLALANCSAIHWADINAGLREVFRVLRKGGQFLIIEEAFASQTEDGRLNSPQDLPDLLKSAGYTVVEHGHHDQSGESYWATLAQKP